MTFHKDGLPAQVLAHLAENGPMERETLNAFMHSIGSDKNAYVAFARLKDAGFIRTKVVLTPEGLAELHGLGWTPQLVTQE